MKKSIEVQQDSLIRIDRRGVVVYPMLDPKDAIRDQLRTQSLDKYSTLEEIINELMEEIWRNKSAIERASKVSQGIVSAGPPALGNY